MSLKIQEAAVALLCVETGLLSREVGEELILRARKSGADPLRGALAHLPARDVLTAVAQAAGLRLVDLDAPEMKLSVNADLFTKGGGLARFTELDSIAMLDEETGRTLLVSANPLLAQVADLRDRIGAHHLVLASASQVRQQLLSAASVAATTAAEEESAAVEELAEESAVLVSEGQVNTWLTGVFMRAVALGASDIHFQPRANGTLWLRLRVDGTLLDQPAPLRGKEREILAAMMGRAGMNQTNSRDPQDGKFTLTAAGRSIDARVNMVPTNNGPKIVARLLDPINISRPLDQMGFWPDQLALLREEAARPQGTILVSGPTGSGKTTLLYGVLGDIATPAKNITTIENPVEYQLDLAAQINVTSDAGDGRGVSFERALRAALRQDPDVILVGEIRDAETARTAAHAAMTGHLVFSTIHTPDALDIYSRLIDMGVERYMVADTVNLLVAQRLLKRPHACAGTRPVTGTEEAFLSQFGSQLTHVPHITGCLGCSGTGYKGRVAVLELLRPDETMKSAVAHGATREELRVHMNRPEVTYMGMVDDAVRHLAAGNTSVEQVKALASGL